MLRRAPAQYGEHRIAAAPGTHDAVATLVAQHVSKDARVLDLGAFTGAMLARLTANGFKQLHAADLVNHLSRSLDLAFTQADFNEDFAQNFGSLQFDCIIASEIIEHLDDPRHFLREIRKLLLPGGIAVVSTPNIAFFEGRIKFLLRGELWGFGANNYRSQRHITPLSREQFPLVLAETGFSLFVMSTAGSFATPLRRVLTAPLWIPMRLLFGPSVLGETLIAVATAIDGQSTAHTSATLWGRAS